MVLYHTDLNFDDQITHGPRHKYNNHTQTNQQAALWCSPPSPKTRPINNRLPNQNSHVWDNFSFLHLRCTSLFFSLLSFSPWAISRLQAPLRKSISKLARWTKFTRPPYENLGLFASHGAVTVRLFLSVICGVHRRVISQSLTNQHHESIQKPLPKNQIGPDRRSFQILGQSHRQSSSSITWQRWRRGCSRPSNLTRFLPLERRGPLVILQSRVMEWHLSRIYRSRRHLYRIIHLWVFIPLFSFLQL